MSESTRRISRIRRPPDATTLYWVMVALVMVIAPHFTHLPWWYPIVLVASIAERLSHIIYRRRPLLAIVRVILTLGCIAGIFLEYGTLIGRQPAVAILSCMLALKLLETYRRREIYLLISLSYFVVVTQFLFSQAIYMSIYLTITVIVITATMYVVETQPHRENRLFKTRPLIAPVRQAGWLLVQGLPLMLCMFVLFPRLASPLWGVPSDNLDNRTGISGEMSPGDMTNLFNDDTPAFRAEFEGAEPGPNERYWRGPVLWAFDGVTWTRRAMWQRGFADPDMSLVDNPLRYRITLEPTQRFWLFGLDVPVSVPRDGGMLDDFSMYHNGPITNLFDYTMVSDSDYRMSPELSVMQQRLALQLPQGFNPQTRTLAEQWRSETSDPMALAQRALRMFRQQPFSYTLSPPPLFTHRVDEFLFQTRAGYCEHYASAFAVMMRAAGVPTRVVTGYQGGYSHPNGYILVRQSDAHAWNEIWVEGTGWVRVDPTAAVAPERVEQAGGASLGQSRGWGDAAWIRSLRNQFDAVHRFWNDVVIKFNRSSQQSLFRDLGGEKMDDRWALLALTFLVVVLLSIVGWFLWRAQRIGGLDPAARVWNRFCDKLGKHGLRRRGSEGPMDFTRRALARWPARREEIEAIRDLFIELRYREVEQDDALLSRLRESVRSFKV